MEEKPFPGQATFAGVGVHLRELLGYSLMGCGGQSPGFGAWLLELVPVKRTPEMAWNRLSAASGGDGLVLGTWKSGEKRDLSGNLRSLTPIP